MMKWYVMQVTTGKELVARNSLLRIGTQAKVPQEETMLRCRGKWNSAVRVLFPGYVFVGSETFEAAEYYSAVKVPGYINFLGRSGTSAEPQAISSLEAEYINLLAPTAAPLPPSIVQSIAKENLVIVSGVLQHLPGHIVKYNLRQRRARVKLSILGEETQVDFSITYEGAAKDETVKEGEKIV